MPVLTSVEVGFYGKLPSHGDFLRRRASDAFVTGWDAWLQAGMTASRADLGEGWLDVYLTSPAWRFACEAGACGSGPVAGVMVPSVDRVGRYFPLTVVAQLPVDVPVVTAATRGVPFFDAAERLLVDTLAADTVDFERFDARVSDLARQLAWVDDEGEVELEPEASAVLQGGTTGWQVPLDASGQLGPVFEQLLARHLGTVFRPLVLWWTEGSAIVDPSCLMGAGLPPPATFGGFLNGAWAQHRWRAVPARVRRAAPVDDDTLDVTPVHVRSAAATDIGLVRTVNQDAFVERPEVGVWVVADGLGGHAHGEVASREVCDALADLGPINGFDELVAAAHDRIQRVNAHLFRASERAALADRCGSTVVALLLRGTRAAVLWAGDSRVYRWRQGTLTRLTDDHSIATPDAEGRQETNAITRAVGVAGSLMVDERREHVLPGDRFLLCSDGLTRIVTDAQLREWMAGPDLRAVVDGLMALALGGGGPDNVTVVVAEAYT